MTPEVEQAALALAESRPKNKHGQLCPVWARRNVSRGRAPTIEQCDCWILRDARVDAAIIAAALSSPETTPAGVLALDTERLRKAIDLSGIGIAEGGSLASDWAEYAALAQLACQAGGCVMTVATKVSDWLSELDSHAIYDTDLLAELTEFGITVKVVDKQAVLSRDAAEAALYLSTIADVAKAMASAPRLGDQLYDDGKPGALMFTGFQLSDALAMLFLGEAPGRRYHGRGSAFRADLKALREGGL